jgi:hypothetical protein
MSTRSYCSGGSYDILEYCIINREIGSLSRYDVVVEVGQAVCVAKALFSIVRHSQYGHRYVQLA